MWFTCCEDTSKGSGHENPRGCIILWIMVMRQKVILLWSYRWCSARVKFTALLCMRRLYTAKLVWLQRWKTIMVIINVHLCYFSNQWKKNSLVGMNMYNCIIWIWLIMVLICSSDYNLPAAIWHFSITINVDRMFDDAMTHFSVLKKVSSGPSCKCWRRIVMCMYSVLPHMLPFAKKNLRLHLVIFPFF